MIPYYQPTRRQNKHNQTRHLSANGQGEPGRKFNQKNLIDKNDPLNLKKIFDHPPENSKEYKKMKLRNTIYQVNDTVMIRNESDLMNDFVGKILKIRSYFPPDEKRAVIVLIQWYYKKNDILGYMPKLKGLQEYISESEVFMSTHKDAIRAESINGPCKILDFREYDENEQNRLENFVFFWRASWNQDKNTLEPPIETWQKHCLCQKPVNPDLPVIQCDLCKEWYHLNCVHLTFEKADQIDNFYCKHCEEKNFNKKAVPTETGVQNQNSNQTQYIIGIKAPISQQHSQA